MVVVLPEISRNIQITPLGKTLSDLREEIFFFFFFFLLNQEKIDSSFFVDKFPMPRVCRGSLILSIKSPRVAGTQLVNLGKMKGCDVRARKPTVAVFKPVPLNW